MLTKKSPKISYKFYCEKCNYRCSRQSEYNKHVLTAKHKSLTNVNKKVSKSLQIFACDICEKQYKSRVGLWKHQQKCSQENIHISVNQETIEESVIKPPTMPDMNLFVDLLKQNQEFKELMIEQSKQIQDQQEENQELHKQLIEAVKHSGHTINHNNTINNNQKFNLHFFLNEQCKDAINMSDFIENIELDMEDLTETGRLGYVGGISRILVNKLQELDIYKRPLHCTDMKRETLYIRENDEWSKEHNSKEKLQEIVEKVSNKNCRTIKQWTDEHPEYNTFDSPENMEYIKLTQAVLGGFGEQETRQFRDKILRSVIKEVMINKI